MADPQVWQILKKLNIKLSYDLAILLLGVYPRELKTYSHTKIIHKCSCSVILNNQKVQTTQMPISWGMDQQFHCMSIQRNIIQRHTKEWSTHTCYSTDEPWIHYAKWQKPDTKIVWVHLYEISRIGKIMETVNTTDLRLVKAAGVRKGWRRTLNGYEAPFGGDKNIQELHNSHGCTLWI